MNTRKPFIIEFTGTPEAGKTTVINLLHKELEKKGYRVKIYPESAEKTPKIFPKECLEAKLWIDSNVVQNILEAQYLLDYDIIIFDRGSIDRIFWIYLDSVYNPVASQKCVPFEMILKNYPPNLLIAFYVSEEESIRRRGGEGRLVTRDFVHNYNHLLVTFINSLGINKVIVSTDNKPIEEVVSVVMNSILEHKSHS